MKYKKPGKLKKGDVVAVLSPSWGGPSIFPEVFENGLKVLREWGLEVKEFPTARMDAAFLRANPQIRARDINDAFLDTNIKAIFTSIGGDDSIRILPFLDKEIIESNPKIFMGFSDNSTIHTFLSLHGIVSFYGPTIIAGFSQMESLPDSFEKHVQKMLFKPSKSHEYLAYDVYSDGYPNWREKENLGKVKTLKKNDGWQWLQGNGAVEGSLFGGCIEVLEMMKATDFWPKKDFWKGKIFFLETSEEKPSVGYVGHVLRNYGMLGVFDQIKGIIFSRARDYSDKEKKDLEKILISVVRDEFGRADMPMIANFDTGHTDPQFVMPLGVKIKIDCKNKKIALMESWMAD